MGAGFEGGLSPRAAGLLARFPGPVRLAPSPLKWLGVLALCLGFVAIGVWIIGTGATASRKSPLAAVWVGWASVLFFGPGILVALLQFLPASSGLVLDADGVESRQFFRRRRWRWAEIGGFGTWDSGHATLVVFEAGAEQGRLAAVNRGLTGRNAALPDTYGLAAADLAALLAAWQHRALAP